MVNSVNYLVGSYERKLRMDKSENTDLGKVLAKETERGRHYEDIAVERCKINADLIEQIATLKAERDQAKARADGLAAKNDAWEKFKSERVRLRNSRDEMVHRERTKAREKAKAKCWGQFSP